MKIKGADIIGKLNKIEPWYFYFFLLVNLVPVMAYKLFPTVDGPAHLYNSRLIVELLKSHHTVLNDFFTFNDNVNPNWSGHFFLALFISVFPAYVAEKIVLLVCLAGLPLGMRYLFHTLSIRNNYLVYLVFPFTYSFLFYYGFYNFNLGIVFFLFGLSLWIKYLQSSLTLRRIIILAFVSTLICLSHIFVFLVFLLVIFIVNISSLFRERPFRKERVTGAAKLILFQCIALSAGLMLTLLYFINLQGNNAPFAYIPYREILVLLQNVSPAKGINYGRANVFTQWIFYMILAFIVYLAAMKTISIIKKETYRLENKTWLIISLVTLLLLFMVPDSKGISIGLITHRLILFFFLFLIVWFASQRVHHWFRILIFMVTAYVNFALVFHNFRESSRGCRLANEMIVASGYIEPYSIVLPIVSTDHILFNHISNYLGAEKPMVILENYEASLDHFPLKWNVMAMPELSFCNSDPLGTVKKRPGHAHETRMVDYVFILDENQGTPGTSYNKDITDYLNSNYTIVYKGETGKTTIFRKADQRNKME